LDDPLLERLRRALAPDFVLERQAAAGGMGIVYRARDVALDRVVAIKVLRPELATAVARERFLLEARLLARLQHPNIVPVHRADERDGLPFYVMDFIEGQTLADRLAAGPFPAADLTRLGHDLLRALGAAHAAGIVHRDVKPQNIFFVGGRALLGDFGISRDAASDDLELTEEGLLLGTREYMAPEQLRGEPATERSDQYSGAAVLYQAASGRQWTALDNPSKANWRGVPRPLATVLQRALAVDPARRWPDMQAVRRAFDRGKHRRLRLFAALALLLVAAYLAKAGFEFLFPPPPLRDPHTLAVLPFTVVGAPSDSLGVLVAEVTDLNLEWFGATRSRVPWSRAVAWREAHPDAAPEAALTDLDAERVVTGSITRRRDALTLQLVLRQPGSTHQLPPIQMALPAEHPDSLGLLAAVAIGTTLGPEPGTDVRNLASRSPAAAGNFSQAQVLFDRDLWDSAAVLYAAAASEDSTFVLARWRHVVSLLWARRISWGEVRELAACCADRLPPLEAGLIRAMSQTDLKTRFAAFDSLNAAKPEDALFYLLFASDLFHRGPLVGRGLPVSLKMFEDAVENSPGGTPAPAYDHLVWGNVRLGEHDAARLWLKNRKRIAGDARILPFIQLGYDLRWSPLRAKWTLWLLKHFAPPADFALLAQFFRFSATWDLPEGQDGVGRVYASRLLTSERASGLEAQGLAQLTWGRVAPGLALIDSAAALFNTEEAELQRHQWRLMLPVLGAGRANAEEESLARTWLESRAAGSDRTAARAQWTLALDAMQQGDTARARGIATHLAAIGTTDRATADLAALTSARLQAGSDPLGALAATTDVLATDSPAPGNDIFARALLHLSRATWFEAVGQPAAARGEILWYENSDTYQFPVAEAQKMEVDAVASVAARLTRARLLLDAGEPAAACLMLSRVRKLWRNADGSLGAAVAHADSLHRAGCV
jgi:hypothetical protein